MHVADSADEGLVVRSELLAVDNGDPAMRLFFSAADQTSAKVLVKVFAAGNPGETLYTLAIERKLNSSRYAGYQTPRDILALAEDVSDKLRDEVLAAKATK